MQPLAAPVRRRQDRHVDRGEVGGADAVVVVDQAAREGFACDVGAVFRELRLRQGLRTRGARPGGNASWAVLAGAVLPAGPLPLEPVFQKVAEEAAVSRPLAVIVGGA